MYEFHTMPLHISYQFMDDKKFYTCYVTYDQYLNLKKLPSIKNCIVLKRNQESYDEYIKEMQIAINMIAKNDTSHIKKLSQNA